MCTLSVTAVGPAFAQRATDAFQRYIAAELAKWRKVAKEMGLKAS